MAFSLALANNVPTIWSKQLLDTKNKQIVAVNLCNREYEGEIKEMGDRVKIFGTTRPTARTYTGGTLTGAEQLPSVSTHLDVDQGVYWNFMIKDIDKRLAMGDLFDKELKDGAAVFAETEDTYVYTTIAAGAGTITDVLSCGATTLPSVISGAIKTLWSNHVPTSEEISIEASPSFCEKVVLSRALHGTDNMATMENGFVDAFRYFNAKLYMSNNIYKDSSNYEYIVVRTKGAVSFASAMNEVEPYRMENDFSDAVKALDIYGAKVIRPKEVVILRVQAYATETAI